MADESDGVGEHLDQSLRLAITLAGTFGERASRLIAEFAQDRQKRAEVEFRDLSARLEAERAAARAELAVVDQSGWWDQAQPDAIAHVHETASTWRAHDDVAEQAAQTIRHEVQERYGFDVDNALPNSVVPAVLYAEAEAERAAERARLAEADEELTLLQLLEAERELENEARMDRLGESLLDENPDGELDYPYRSDAELERDAAVLEYDSAERRAHFAGTLEGKAEEDVIKARLLADGDQARHPREAVLAGAAQPKAARKATPTALERERGGLSQ